jgi:hypothetical protein
MAKLPCSILMEVKIVSSFRIAARKAVVAFILMALSLDGDRRNVDKSQ